VHTFFWGVESDPQEVNIPKSRCPNCKLVDVQKHGSDRAKSLGASGKRERIIQHNCCLDCHRWFSEKAEAKTTKRYESSLILWHKLDQVLPKKMSISGTRSQKIQYDIVS